MALPIILLLAVCFLFIFLYVTAGDKPGKTPPNHNKYPDQYYRPKSHGGASMPPPAEEVANNPIISSANNTAPADKPAPVPAASALPVNITPTVSGPPANPAKPATASFPAWYISGHQLKAVQQAAGKSAIFSIFTYYPKRYTGAPSEVEETRRLIYSFKDGRNTMQVANIVCSALYATLAGLKRLDDAHKLSFAIVPASTNAKNEMRYRQFCEMVCRNMKFANLFEAIKINSDRDALKGVVGVSKTDNLIYDQQLIAGKPILLFDDVKTTGASLHQNRAKLMDLGARSVLPIVLAETYSERNNGLPYWYITPYSAPAEDKGGDLPF